MERRTETRVQVDMPVSLTFLTEPEGTLSGVLVNLSGTGGRLRVPQRAVPGTLVQFNWENRLILAEVMYCEPMGEEFAIGLAFKHVLCRSAELTNLFASVWAEQAGAVPQAMTFPMRRKQPAS